MTSPNLQVVTSSCQATNQQSLIQPRQLRKFLARLLLKTAFNTFVLFQSISVPGESRLGSVESTTPFTPAVATETALEFNVSTVLQPPPSASGEARALVAGSSVTTLPGMNVNHGKIDKSTLNPSEMTSADTIGKNEPEYNIFFF